jgi:TPR repeat protein
MKVKANSLLNVLACILIGLAVLPHGHAQTTTAGNAPKHPIDTWETISNRWGGVSLAKLTESAQHGDPTAQYYLAGLYWDGQSVTRDTAQAVKWFRSAAESGLAVAQYSMGWFAERQPELLGNTVGGNYQAAAEWFEKAAVQGEPRAAFHLGDLYLYGKIERNHREAAKWFRVAAAKGNEEAVLRLGELYRHNRSDLRQDHAESARWFRLAAEKGNPDAQYELGCLLIEGEGIPHNPAEAEMWLRKAADGGNARARLKLATLKESSGGVVGSELSRNDLEMAAIARDPSEARFRLAMAYEEGQGGPTNLYRAVGLYWAVVSDRLSPKRGEAIARLVNLYANHRVEPKTPSQPGDLEGTPGLASFYFDHAPRGSDKLAERFQQNEQSVTSSRAQFQLGDMYDRGDVLPEDGAKAVSWFQRAAQGGSAEARNRLGELWAAGINGEPDAKEAARWYRRAAMQGLAAAQFNLGRAAERGDGVEQSSVEAWAWYRLAADRGDTKARQALEQLQARMDAGSLAKAATVARVYEKSIRTTPNH